jgi:hypothetical protein
MNKKQIKNLAAQIMSMVVEQDGEMVLSYSKKFTDADLCKLDTILRKYNVQADFNQIYNEKTNTLSLDKTTLLIGLN